MRVVNQKVFIALAIWFCTATAVFADECDRNPPPRANLTNGSSDSLVSPDGKWRLKTTAGKSVDEFQSTIYVEDTRSPRKWVFGSIKRWGTAFWSQDSERLFLLDAYAADEMRIRVFDVTGTVPKEIEGVNRVMQRAVFARIPKDEETLWFTYPKICFADGDSSAVIVTVDAPLALKTGGPGKDFRLKITFNLNSHDIQVSGPAAPRSP
jgi:hypothetical protein